MDTASTVFQFWWDIERNDKNVLFTSMPFALGQVYVKFGYVGMPFYTVSLTERDIITRESIFNHYTSYRKRSLALRHAGKCCRMIAIKAFLNLATGLSNNMKDQIRDALDWQIKTEGKF
jgi:hypothetical protein